MEINSSFHAVSIPDDITFPELMLNEFMKCPDRTALVDVPTGRQFTFKELGENVVRLGSALARLGMRRGDVVLVCAPNSADYTMVLLAVTRICAIVTGVNIIFTPDEIAKQLRDSRAQYIFTTPPLLQKVNKAVSHYGYVKQIIIIGDTPAGFTSFSELLKDDGKALPNHTINSKTEVALLPYSSGTTGLPKGVMLSHYNIMANMIQLRHEENSVYEVDTDTVVLFQPLFHVSGMVLVFCAAMYSRVKLVVLGPFDYYRFLEAVSYHKASILFLLPPLAVRMSKDPTLNKYDFSHVRCIGCGAAPVSADVLREVADKINVKPENINQGYGMTEGVCVSHLKPNGFLKIDSVGKLIPNCQSKIVDIDTGSTLGIGGVGEVCIRGPQVMLGYLNRPDATANTIDNGWLHTGDVGYYDEEGFLFLKDRVKELIKFKGYQVAPAELEALILLHEDVADVAVVGIPDERAGELPRAYVVLKPERSPNSQSIMDFTSERLAPYKHLRGGIRFTDVIPKSPSGKILRRKLRDEILQESTTKSKL